MREREEGVTRCSSFSLSQQGSQLMLRFGKLNTQKPKNFKRFSLSKHLFIHLSVGQSCYGIKRSLCWCGICLFLPRLKKVA